MDLTSKVNRLSQETTALRAEVQQLKELLESQHELIVSLLENKPPLIQPQSSHLTSTPSDQIFPLSTQEDMDKIEKLLEETNMDHMILVAKSLLQPDGVKKNLHRILSSNLIVDYNLNGINGKKNFSAYTNLMNLLHQATDKEGYTLKSFMEDMRTGFYNAKKAHFHRLRYKRRKDKNRPILGEERSVKVEEIFMPDTEMTDYT